MARKKTPRKSVKALTHDSAKRTNIPTAEHQSVMSPDEQAPVRVAYQRRNPDVDPQLVWRGKDMQSWSELVVQAAPLYIQEKVHPKVLIDDLQRRSQIDEQESAEQPDLFADFNGLPDGAEKTEFYRHDANWSNRMILGDSLQVMASLAEREGLRGKVQCIYLDPPYGIKFNSNFQWSTTSRDVKDGKAEHITREPEQVKAFRDTWRDGIHSYLSYLRDRLIAARDLLTDSGSVFVQIGDENVHRVRALMDEVFGEENFVSQITFSRAAARGTGTKSLDNVADCLLWFKKGVAIKYRQLYRAVDPKSSDPSMAPFSYLYLPDGLRRTMSKSEKNNPAILTDNARRYRIVSLSSQTRADSAMLAYDYQGKAFRPPPGRGWAASFKGIERLAKADRLQRSGNSLGYISLADERPGIAHTNQWTDTASIREEKSYVVQTAAKIVQRCILMTTDPGDLVLDPTCGSGTTAYVAEQWGRRWITIDTSRVALALARARIMGARYPYYLLADSPAGQQKEAEITGKAPSEKETYGDLRQGFVYERVPHITLKSIANNAEIDVIWGKWQETLDSLRGQLNKALKQNWEEWEIPRQAEEDWPAAAQTAHGQWWDGRIARQREIDTSIAAGADYEYLYDKPYEDKKTVRVAGPFTVESISPHRTLGVDENDELVEGVAYQPPGYQGEADFSTMILENLKVAGVQQAHKEDRIRFTSLAPWPGKLVCAEGRYTEGAAEDEEDAAGPERRAAVFIGPEFGTVSRPDLVAAASEAAEAGFDVLVACAFNYDARSTEIKKLGRIPVLKARMNADLHLADNFAKTSAGNLFVIFGEPDIELLEAEEDQVQIKIKGVDVFHPQTGEIHSDGADGIACWFIDTDYNEESFFVRHAYFLGADDPYKKLKTTLKAEIDQETWATLHSDVSRPFPRPPSGRIAVKVINHLGDEVMKILKA